MIALAHKLAMNTQVVPTGTLRKRIKRGKMLPEPQPTSFS